MFDTNTDLDREELWYIAETSGTYYFSIMSYETYSNSYDLWVDIQTFDSVIFQDDFEAIGWEPEWTGYGGSNYWHENFTADARSGNRVLWSSLQISLSSSINQQLHACQTSNIFGVRFTITGRGGKI